MAENNIRLLLVDDEDGFKQPLAKRLGRRGLEALMASSGQEALSVLAEQPVDVVVLDVKMPGMDGLETLAKIRERHPGVEVILLTGHASTADGVEGIKAGAFDYLTKPIEFEHLLSKIGQAQDKRLRAREKREETAFREKIRQQMIATERLASLGTLAAGVAHEINNPLAIISESVGWLRSLLNKEELKDMPHRDGFIMALEKIETSKERAKRITHQLLGFARKTDSLIQETDLAVLLNEVSQLVAREAAAREVRVETDVPPESNRIFTDPNQLRQVVLNLVTNALQATPPGGLVRLLVRQEQNGLRLEVVDTGEGIPKENLQRIFEPFFSTKPPGKGTGLGLSVSLGIVEKLGGRIEVKSELGRGTTFCVHLPRHYTPAGRNSA